MKVFVVLEMNGHSDYNYCGVYSSNEKAEQRIEEIVKAFNKDSDNFYIQEEEI